MKNVVGYIRVSTDEQAEGYSLATQEMLILQYAASRGWQVHQIYRDAGLSGRSEQRPGLAHLLQEAQAGRFEAVIVHSVDRLYRNLEALLKTLHLFQTHQVALVSLSENLDFTTPWGKLTLTVLGILAEIYIDKLSAETRRGKLYRAHQGFWNGSIPLGYCNGCCSRCTDSNGPGYCPNIGSPDQGNGRDLILHPIESVALRLAFQWYITGNFSDGQIAEKLNAYRYQLPDGTVVPFRTKGRPGRSTPGPFSKDGVRDLLTRVFYTGFVPYFGLNEKGQKRKRYDAASLHPGRHPALIDQTTFEQAQEIRKLLGRHPRTRQQTPARLYLLSGLLHCGQCGAKMRAQGGSKDQQYYVCSARLQHIGSCSQSAINANQIEAQLLELLRQIQLPPDWQERVLQELGHDPAELAQKRADIKSRLIRTAKIYEAGLLSDEAWEEARRASEFALADLTNQNVHDILSAENQLCQLQGMAEGVEINNIEIKKQLRGLVAVAFAQGVTLSAVRFTEAMYPLVKLVLQAGKSFYSGSDGT